MTAADSSAVNTARTLPSDAGGQSEPPLSIAQRELRKPAHYPSLDGLRGLAALMVVYGHAGYLRWVPLVTGCATIGVVLFFFLSGFLMGHHYLPSASSGALKTGALKYWSAFLLRRFVRVYPPYFFAPILGFLLLMPRMPPDFQKKIPMENLSVFDELIKIATFGGNLGIYWTVEIELFFYLLYPFFIVVCLLVRNSAGTLLALCVGLIFFNHFPYGLGGVSWTFPLPGLWAGYIAIFVAGIFASVVARKIPGWRYSKLFHWNALALISFAAFILAVALISRSRPTQEFIWKLEWLFAALLFVLFISLVHSDGVMNKLFSSRVCVLIGRVSYSLYLIHIIAFYIVIHHFSRKHHGIVAAILVLLVVTPAYYALFERPFVRLSKKIKVGGQTG